MKAPIIRIDREYRTHCTIGFGSLETEEGIYRFATLELPDKENQRRVSCIPEGCYDFKLHTSPKFGRTLWVQNVPGRSEILIHTGNFTRDILGCILVGTDHAEIDGDGITDVINSRVAMNEILSKCKSDGHIYIS